MICLITVVVQTVSKYLSFLWNWSSSLERSLEGCTELCIAYADQILGTGRSSEKYLLLTSWQRQFSQILELGEWKNGVGERENGMKDYVKTMRKNFVMASLSYLASLAACHFQSMKNKWVI